MTGAVLVENRLWAGFYLSILFILQKIFLHGNSNNISPMIPLEEDYCSMHNNKLLPIFDLQVQMQ